MAIPILMPSLNWPNTNFLRPNCSISKAILRGEIIDFIQKTGLDPAFSGIILNAGAYAHTSIAIADAVSAVKTPVIGVHLSNIYKREAERHIDLLSAACIGNISGFGLSGYELAISYLLEKT